MAQQIRRQPAQRDIQDLDRVDYRCPLMLTRERRLDLQRAAWVARSDYIGLQVRYEFGLAITKGFGGVRLDEIVDSCGPAADGRFGNFSKFKAGNAREQRAWLRAHTLRMLQMAGIVERHA